MKFLVQLKFLIAYTLFLFNFNAIAGLTAEATPTSSPSSNDGTIDLTITGGFAPYEISWKGPGGYTSSEEDLEDLASGIYDVEVTDALCGIAILSITVESCPVSVIVNIKPIYPCRDQKNGQLKVSLNGSGTLPFSWECRQFFSGTVVASGQINQLDPYSINVFDVNGLGAAIYSFTIIDAFGCEDTRNVIFRASDTKIEGEVETSCSPSSGTIRLSVNTSYINPPLQYEWDDGVSTKDRFGLSSGQYCVKVSDANGCSATECFTVNSNTLKANIASVTNNQSCGTQCNGSIIIDVISLGSLNYQWSGPNGYTANTKNISNLCNGSYSVTISNGQGCQTVLETTICCCYDGIQPPPDGEEPEPNPNLCFNPPYNPENPNAESPPIVIKINEIMQIDANTSTGSIDLNVTGGVRDLFYSWTGPDGFTGSTKSISGLEKGTYCLTVTDGCDSKTQCFEIVDCQETPWDVNSVIHVACPSYDVGSIELNVSGAAAPYNYQWSNGANSQNIYNLRAGTYCVTITDKNNCIFNNCWTVSLEATEQYWNVCTYVIECGDEKIVEQSYPVITQQHPTKCYYTQTICTATNTVLSENKEEYSYSLIDDCTLGRYNSVTGKLCEIFYGERRSEIVSGCDSCPDGAYCDKVEYCYYNIYDDGNLYNITSVTNQLIVAHVGCCGVCQQVNYCRGIWGENEELCRCYVDSIRCVGNFNGAEYSGLETLNLNENFYAIDPIHEQIIRDISELENGAQVIDNYDFEVKDPMNNIVYSKDGAREMTANERSEYTEHPSSSIKQEINIFPNPSLGNYHINITGRLEGKIKMRVYDLQGHLLQEENWLNLQGTLILNEQIASGIYIIEFLGSDWNARERIIKLQ